MLRATSTTLDSKSVCAMLAAMMVVMMDVQWACWWLHSQLYNLQL